MNIGEKFYCSKCMREMDDEGICPFCGYDAQEPVNDSVLEEGALLQSGRYQLGAVIGRGGFGITYAAWDHTLQIPVAIKEYFPDDLVSRDINVKYEAEIEEDNKDIYELGLRRFSREAGILATLQNVKNVVTVLDWFEKNHTAYLVMEFVRGVTLDEYVKNEKLTSAEILALLRDPIDALVSIHQLGVLHRDISPKNFMVQKDGSIKLIDFGSAAVLERREKGKDNTVILSKCYAALEQYDVKGMQGPWTDVYGMSATIYALLTGEVPPEAVIRQVRDTMPSLKECDVHLKSWQEKAIMNGLTVVPDKRIQSMDEFRARLYHLPLPEEVVQRNKYRNRMICGMADVFLLMLLVVLNFTVGFPIKDGLSAALHFDGWHIIKERQQKEERVLPKSWCFIPVTAIDDFAFRKSKSLKEITIPGNIDRIGENAFYECESLRTVTMEEGVKHLGDNAFTKCDDLRTVYLPDSVEEIKDSVFDQDSKYLTVWVSDQSELRTEESEINFAKESDFEWEENDEGEVTLISYNGDNQNLVIPSEIDGKQVTELYNTKNDDSFSVPETVTTIVLPEYLKKLPSNFIEKIFSGSPNGFIEKVTLNPNLKTIGTGALAGVIIERLEIPDGLISFEERAFEATFVHTITIPNTVKKINDETFQFSYLKNIELPPTVEYYGSNIFADCNFLEKVVLPDTMSEITEYMFLDCTSLSEIELPKKVEKINEGAFQHCINLEYIIVPEGTKSIESQAFAECSELSYIEIPSSVEKISPDAFESCRKDLIVCGNAGTVAENYANDHNFDFEDKGKWENKIEYYSDEASTVIITENCNSKIILPSYNAEYQTPIRSIDSVSIPKNIKSIRLPLLADTIEYSAFDAHNFPNVKNLNEVITSKKLKIIEESAFYGCENLEYFKFPEKLEEIEQYAFSETNLKEIVLPKSLRLLGEGAFYSCRNLENIYLPENDVLTYLNYNTFSETGIHDLVLPSNIRKCDGTFQNCQKLENVTAEDGLQELSRTFYNCNNLKTVNLPSTIKKIDMEAFSDCENLRDIYIYSMDVKIDESVFTNSPNVVIHTYEGSTAESFAKENDIAFKVL